MMRSKSKNETYADDARTKIGTVIGGGTVFDGDLSSPEAVRIDGIINGNCTCEKKLILSAEGQVKGNISAQSVIISGKVDGDIVVSGKLELLSTGKIAGNITASSIVIDEGACFDGRCTMTTTVETVPGSIPDSIPDSAPVKVVEEQEEKEKDSFNGRKK